MLQRPQPARRAGGVGRRLKALHERSGFLFRDIEVCHGNLWLADVRLLQNSRATGRIDRIYRARKNPVATALAVGLPVGLAYVLGVHLLHALTLEQMTRIAARHFGLAGEAVIVEHPEITIDVDEAEDYRFVVEQLGV